MTVIKIYEDYGENYAIMFTNIQADPLCNESLAPKICQSTHAVGFPGSALVKNLSAYAGDARDSGPVPGSGRSSGVGTSNPLQYSCLENSMGRGAWVGYS